MHLSFNVYLQSLIIETDMESGTAIMELTYSPSAVLNLFNNAIAVSQARKLIQLKGIFQPGKGQNYSGFYYDSIRDESSDAQLTVIVPELIRKDITPNKTITVNGFITKRVVNTGSRIEIQFTVTDLVEQTHNKYSEEDIKTIELLQKKASSGYHDVHSWIKERIINSEPFRTVIISGKTGIIDNDIKHLLKESLAFYDITFHKISLSSETEILNAVDHFDNLGYEIIIVARGGGENLDIFNKPSLAEKCTGLKALFITAIGHKDDVTLLQKVADKAFITPSELGHFLNDTYNHTIEEVQNSKAKLVESVTTQLKANYQKQIDNLNEKLTALEELKAKTSVELQKVNDEKIAALNQQIALITKNHNDQLVKTQGLQSEKLAMLDQQLKALTEQNKSKDNLLNSYKTQLASAESKGNIGWAAIIIGIIIGLILGMAIAGR